MKVLNPLKVPFGTGRFAPIDSVKYLQWEDAFEVDFADGLSFLEPHQTVRRNNRVAADAVVQSVEVEEECRAGFFVNYDNGQSAEVSWSFIREYAPARR